MKTLLLAAAEQVATEPETADVLRQALQVSAAGMLGIFVVMGLFAAMIVALTRFFPDEQASS